MKKLRIRYYSLKATLILSFLTVMGFAACDGEDVQPEYGVPAVREKTAKDNQQGKDTIVKVAEIKTEDNIGK